MSDLTTGLRHLSDFKLTQRIAQVARELDRGVALYEALLAERDLRSARAADPAPPRPVIEPVAEPAPPATPVEAAGPAILAPKSETGRGGWDGVLFEPWAERKARRAAERAGAVA